MFKTYNNKIISADWHLLHKNINLYEFPKRKEFFIDTYQDIAYKLPNILDGMQDMTREQLKDAYRQIDPFLF